MIYFMSPPGLHWQLKARANFRSANATQVDAKKAQQEWLALANAIEACGGTVCVCLPDDDALTGMPFAAEAGHVVGETFLLPRMLHPHRQPEASRWKALAEKMQLKTVQPETGIWEAQGDVAEHQGTTLLFYGGRTNEEGLVGVKSLFPSTALVLQIQEPAFHGNMALLPLPTALLACRQVFSAESWTELQNRFSRIIEVTEEEIRTYATNSLLIGNTVLAPSCVPKRITTLFETEGLQVKSLPMHELCEKGGGASRCLISVADLDAGRIPKPHRLDAARDWLEQTARESISRSC